MYLREMAAVFHQMIEKHLTTNSLKMFWIVYSLSPSDMVSSKSVLQTGLRDGKLHCAHCFLHLYLICKQYCQQVQFIVQ